MINRNITIVLGRWITFPHVHKNHAQTNPSKHRLNNFTHMEYRNLKRFFLIGKVLRKYNKKASFEITTRRLHILLTFQFMEQYNKPASFHITYNTFISLGHSAGWHNFLMDLNKLEENRLIELYIATYNNRKVKRYRLTTIGKITLMNLETALRKERFDK